MIIFRFIWFLIRDVMWEGFSFFLEAPVAVWKEFKEKENKRTKEKKGRNNN